MTDQTEGYSAAAEVGRFRTRRTWRQRAWIELKKAPPTALFGLLVIAGYIFVAVFAPWLAPYGEAEVFAQSFAPWSAEHPFGTDQSIAKERREGRVGPFPSSKGGRS